MTEILTQVEAKNGGHDDASQHSRNLLVNEANASILSKDTGSNPAVHGLPIMTIDWMTQNQNAHLGRKPDDFSGAGAKPGMHAFPIMTDDGIAQNQTSNPAHKPSDVSGIPSQKPSKDTGVWGTGFDGRPGTCPPGAMCEF